MKTLRLLGLGLSLYEAQPIPPTGVEVWGLQYTWKSHQLDRAFVMDEEAWIVSKNNTLGRDIVKEINSYEFSVYVSKPWANLDKWVEYPLEHVVSGIPNLKHRVLEKTERGEEWTEVQGKYFLNSFCYMLALAIFEGFERIELYGIDMANMNGRLSPNETWEDERSCVSFWVGVAIGRGIEVVISGGSRVTKPISPDSPTLYGYEKNKHLEDIRSKVLADNSKYENALRSGKVSYEGNTKIIDLTESGIKFNVYRKEDLPNAKAGDVVAEAKPYATINELDKTKI